MCVGEQKGYVEYGIEKKGKKKKGIGRTRLFFAFFCLFVRDYFKMGANRKKKWRSCKEKKKREKKRERE